MLKILQNFKFTPPEDTIALNECLRKIADWLNSNDQEDRLIILDEFTTFMNSCTIQFDDYTWQEMKRIFAFLGLDGH